MIFNATLYCGHLCWRLLTQSELAVLPYAQAFTAFTDSSYTCIRPRCLDSGIAIPYTRERNEATCLLSWRWIVSSFRETCWLSILLEALWIGSSLVQMNFGYLVPRCTLCMLGISTKMALEVHIGSVRERVGLMTRQSRTIPCFGP